MSLIIFSDEARISQVLTNFVSNAFKFTSNGYIELGLSHTNNEILFSVKDTGIGIPKDYHEKVFDRFRQVEAAQTRKYGGIGLGLSITKNLVDLMGGRLWLESVPQVGSTFYFALPETIIVSQA
jgi:signal transduction histidine kinase